LLFLIKYISEILVSWLNSERVKHVETDSCYASKSIVENVQATIYTMIH
jgi:hypothetical protein